MAKRRKRRSRLQKLAADVFGVVKSARDASKSAVQQLRKEISATRSKLGKLVTEERSFRLDLFGTGAPGRPQRAAKSRKPGRPAGRKAVGRRAKPRSKGPAKADKFLAKLPSKLTIDDVRKVAGKAAPISLSQWARSKKVKKVAGGYQNAA
jgi:hypothetical protein